MWRHSCPVCQKGLQVHAALEVFPFECVKGARQKTCEALRLRVKEVEGSS